MHSGHRKIILSEQGKDLIRVEFHKLIQEKVYPTSAKLLKRLKEQCDDFPIRSASTLRQKMRSVSKIFFVTYIREKKKHQTIFFIF